MGLLLWLDLGFIARLCNGFVVCSDSFSILISIMYLLLWWLILIFGRLFPLLNRLLRHHLIIIIIYFLFFYYLFPIVLSLFSFLSLSLLFQKEPINYLLNLLIRLTLKLFLIFLQLHYQITNWLRSLILINIQFSKILLFL